MTKSVRVVQAKLGRKAAASSPPALVVVPAVSKVAATPVANHTIWDRPGYLVRRLHQIHVAMFSARVADGQVTPVQFGLLSILISRPGIDQATLGAELGLDPANVAEILRRLEDRNLLTPLNPADRQVFMELLGRLVEGNNENGRTSLRPGGEALKARGRRVGEP